MRRHRKHQPAVDDVEHPWPEFDLSEVQRVVLLVRDRTQRTRLLASLDEVDRRFRWDPIAEIKATTELESMRRRLDSATERARRAEARNAELLDAVGTARRAQRAAERRLAEVREMLTADLADRLLDVATRAEARHPTEPPMISVRRAAAVVRAIEAGWSGRSSHGEHPSRPTSMSSRSGGSDPARSR